MKQQKRILVIVIGGLGDCLLFHPLCCRLKETWPDSRVDILTGCFVDMWKLIDKVDNVLVFGLNRNKSLSGYAALFHALYHAQYDIVIEGLSLVPLHGIYPILSSLVFTASRSPIRIGRSSTGRRLLLHPQMPSYPTLEIMLEPIWFPKPPWKDISNPYLTHTVNMIHPQNRTCHESSQLLTPLGIPYQRHRDEPRIHPDPLKYQWAINLVRSHWAGKHDIVVAFSTEVTKLIKSWPTEYFVTVISKGISEGFKFIMLGLVPDSLESPFRQFPKSSLLRLSGRTDLSELIALISVADVFLSCDSGPAHIAQALKIPSIVLFGPSNEKEFGPVDSELHTLVLPKGNYRCRPCVLGPCMMEKRCMLDIDPDDVFEILQNQSRKRQSVLKPLHISDQKESPCVICRI